LECFCIAGQSDHAEVAVDGKITTRANFNGRCREYSGMTAIRNVPSPSSNLRTTLSKPANARAEVAPDAQRSAIAATADRFEASAPKSTLVAGNAVGAAVTFALGVASMVGGSNTLIGIDKQRMHLRPSTPATELVVPQRGLRGI
jgi:hypothetical protein